MCCEGWLADWLVASSFSVANLSMSLSDVAVPINGDAEQRFESGNENLGQFGTRSIWYNMPALYEEALFALVCYILPES